MPRANFSAETKDIIAKRAAYRCCFPGCNATLIGPDSEPNSFCNIGECAHIYAASNKGPRGNHSLSKTDLQKPENGIFLCTKHHEIIDKGGGKKYPPETLMLYKQTHEHMIAGELGHISYPLLWLSKLEILESPVLKSGIVYSFTKSTILFGSNGSGKTFLMDYIYTFLTGKTTIRTKNKRIKMKATLSNPIWTDVICEVNNGVVRYKINDNEITFCPFSIDVVYLREGNGRQKGDNIDWIRNQVGEDRQFVKNLIEGADLSNGTFAIFAELQTIRKKPYETIRVNLRKKTDAEDDSLWDLEQCSGTEQSSFVFDLLIDRMRQLSRYKNTLFLLDWSYFNCYDDRKMNSYYHLFQDFSSYFQTISTLHTLWEGVDWAGWNMVKMARQTNVKRQNKMSNNKQYDYGRRI